MRIRRLTGEFVLWRPGFVEHTNINRFSRIEDFDVGGLLGLKLGFAPRAFGSSDDEGYVRLRLNFGAETPLGFGWARATGSSRLAPEQVERILQLDARWYTQLRPTHTFAIGASGLSGYNTPRDFQASAGGLDGLRAYPVDAVAGQRLWRLNAEERWRFSPERWDFIILGSAVFFDAARAWGTGAADTGWFRNAGIGLRVGSRSWGLSEIMRVDIAWPIEPTRNGGNRTVLTFGSSQAF
jgi:hemolysin activation/secretion protein